MTLNEHVNVNTQVSEYTDMFTPDDGYALWRDNQEGNIDENGEPMQYYLKMRIQKSHSEEYSYHILAKLIDETMYIFENTEYQMGKMRSTEPVSHTYIDENGIERQKKGVF